MPPALSYLSVQWRATRRLQTPFPGLRSSQHSAHAASSSSSNESHVCASRFLTHGKSALTPLTISSAVVYYCSALCFSLRLYSITHAAFKSHSTHHSASNAAHYSATAASTPAKPRSSIQHSARRRRSLRTIDTSAPAAEFVRDDLLLSAQQQHHGIFQSQHIKPFPVRAAIDIGTGGVISLCIGRVDARAGAVQKFMYQTQLPLYLEKLVPPDQQHASGNNGADLSDVCTENRSFTLSERTVDDIRNKMRVLHGVMRRNTFEGLSERAAVLSWPLCLASNALSLAEALTREFKVDVRVLGKTFQVAWPPLSVPVYTNPTLSFTVSDATAAVTHEANQTNWSAGATDRRADVKADPRSSASNITSLSGDKLKALLQKVSTKDDDSASRKATNPSSEAQQSSGGDRHSGDTDESCTQQTDLRTQIDTLAFLAHAAVSQCVAPQRLLVLSEDPQRGVRVLGLATTPAAEVADLLEAADNTDAVAKLKQIAFGNESSSASTTTANTTSSGSLPLARGSTTGAATVFSDRRFSSKLPASKSVVPVVTAQEGLGLVEHTLPVDVATAHRYCITYIQRRPLESYGLHTSSPNPLLADEFASLRGLLTDMIAHNLPKWVKRKAQLGGMLVATSHNGGLFNIAARVAQQTNVSLEHLEVHAQHHFCGLTDVLLAEVFPNPLTVLPSAALGAAVLRALESPRLVYVPEVTMAAALLVQPGLWLASRSDEVRQRLSKDPFYAAHTRQQRGRVFERPHRKENPTAAPDATWTRGGRWNSLSYEESMKGT